MTKETTPSDDNWGWRARIGMFIVGSEAVPEAEWGAMVPPGVSVHAARVTGKTPWAAWRENKTEVDLAADLVRGAKQLAAMSLTAVVLGHTSSSVVGGKGCDEDIAHAEADPVGVSSPEDCLVGCPT